MQELRLLGVHQDERHILLVAANGAKFQLAITSDLRAAVRRVPYSADADRSDSINLSPRDIQSQIRSGMTAEQISEAARIPLEHVKRYEGPVLAERSHMCTLAQQTSIARADGDGRERLGDLVTERLYMREVHTEPSWDAWRREDASWVVQLSFEAGGKTRNAQWSFIPRRAHIEPLDDEARWFVAEGNATPPSLEPVEHVDAAPSAELAREQDVEALRTPVESIVNAAPDASVPDEDLPPAAHASEDTEPEPEPREDQAAKAESAATTVPQPASPPSDISAPQPSMPNQPGSSDERSRPKKKVRGGRNKVSRPEKVMPGPRDAQSSASRPSQVPPTAPSKPAGNKAVATSAADTQPQGGTSVIEMPEEQSLSIAVEASADMEDPTSTQSTDSQEKTARTTTTAPKTASSSKRPNFPKWDEIVFGPRKD